MILMRPIFLYGNYRWSMTTLDILTVDFKFRICEYLTFKKLKQILLVTLIVRFLIFGIRNQRSNC